MVRRQGHRELATSDSRRGAQHHGSRRKRSLRLPGRAAGRHRPRAGEDYTTSDGGYDVPRRLGDVLRSDEVTALDTSAATMRDGDVWARWARGWALLALALAAAYVVRAGLRERRRRRQADRSPLDIGLIPSPWDEPRRRRLVGMIALAAWVALPVLTAEQLSLSMDSARAAAQSSRLISQVSGAVMVSQVRNGASDDLQMRGMDLTMWGLARQYAATFDGSRGQQLLGTTRWRSACSWPPLPPPPSWSVRWPGSPLAASPSNACCPTTQPPTSRELATVTRRRKNFSEGL
jgi:hypothetical protein